MKILQHSLILVGSFVLVFIWQQSYLTAYDLTPYTIQFLAGIVAAYFILSFIRRKMHKQNPNFNGGTDIFMLNTAILFLTGLTGNIYSPLFFLLYFLGFGIAFIFEPATVFVFTIGTICIFLPEALKNGSMESFIRLGSLLLISPLAFFFGQEYKDRDRQQAEMEAMEERSSDAANTISKDVEEVLKKEKDVLKPEEVQKLNEILEETEELREEITDTKNS